jgi:allantoin racemase
MGLKICWQNVVPHKLDIIPGYGIILEGLERMAQKVVRSDTEVTIRPLPRCSQLPLNPYFLSFTVSEVVEGVIQSEREGYDAVMIGCYLDPGLQIARTAVDIPVTGPSVSAMLLAQLLGRKFACVTIAPEAIPMLEQNLKLYNLEDCAIKIRPIRAFPIKWEDLVECYRGNGGSFITQFERVAQGCIDDGADVIITGCAWVGPAFTLMNYRSIGRTNVPVLDCSAAGLMMAELLADMKKKLDIGKSQGITSIYKSPEKTALDSLRAEFGL